MMDNHIDNCPICWACGEEMTWTGEYREVVLDGVITVEEPIYACYNPDCNDDDPDE